MERKPKKSKQLCSGCRNDFYNDHNPLGVKECWSYKKARIIKRMRVGTWEPPPYHPSRMKWFFDCYHYDGGMSMIEENDPRIREEAKQT
jgi:hypothetical protein